MTDALTIPVWPEAGTPEGVTFFGNARMIAAAWKAHGVSNPFALAMLTMAEAESSLNPNAMGDHVDGEATAFGMHQWHAARLAVIKTATGIDVVADVKAGRGSIQTQVEAAWFELAKFAWAGKTAIEAQTHARLAAVQATALFERAGAVDAANRRGQMAERWAAWFGKMI